MPLRFKSYSERIRDVKRGTGFHDQRSVAKPPPPTPSPLMAELAARGGMVERSGSGEEEEEEEGRGGESAEEQLRYVFDLCDGDKDGVISVDEFRQIGRHHFDKTKVGAATLYLAALPSSLFLSLLHEPLL